MKKNISINISGIIFHIEEDGFDRLREYLDTINRYFSTFDDSTEIVADIESRIAEIFLSKLKEANRQVVTADDVQELVATMGTVADFQAIEEDVPTEKQKVKPEEATSEKETEDEPKATAQPDKRLFRDMRRRILGGVSSGIAHYFSIDPLWVRLIFIILTFGLYGIALLAYIIMWIVVPAAHNLEEDQKIKKMYRNPEGKVLGGVANGLSAYFATDVAVIRLLFVASIFLGGSGFIIYIILWAITPEAKSITEKMQMQGEPVTLSNIEHTVKDRLNDKSEEESAITKILLFPFRLIAMVFTTLAEIAGPAVMFFLEAIRVLVAIVIILTGLCLIFAMVLFTSVMLGFFSGLEGWVTMGDLPFEVFNNAVSPLAILFMFIAVFIPILAVTLLGFTLLLKRSITNSYIGWSLFALWIIGLIGSSFYVPRTIADFVRTGSVSKTEVFDLKGKQALLTLRDIEQRDYEGVNLSIRGHEESTYLLVTDFESKGRTREIAEDYAKMISYNVILNDSVFTFDPHIEFNEGAVFRMQEAEVILYIPFGQTFKMDYSINDILKRSSLSGYSSRDLEDNEWVFTEYGLECNTCGGNRRRGRSYDNREYDPDDYEEGRSMSRVFEFEDFDEVKISDKIDVEIREGDNYSVELFASQRVLDKIKARQYGDMLTLDMQDWAWFRMRRSRPVQVEITMPKLISLDLSGSSSADVSGFSGDFLAVDLSGSADAELDIDYERIEIDMGGSSDLQISGTASDLIAEVSSSSSLNALDLECKIADIRASSSANVRVWVIDQLEVEASGSSAVRYKGNPELDIDEGRAATVKAY
ncbi:MAG: DUF2807 domain-containing protein [Cyclobacteriaceae bacterium]